MMRSLCRLLGLTLPLTFTALAIGQEPVFTPLFNGTDLSGWHLGKEVLHKQPETPDKRFYAAGGILVLASKDKDGNKGGKHLVALREFSKDFILKLEFKASQEAKAYLTVRNVQIPVGDYLRIGEQKHLKKVFKNDDWNELEVTVKMVAHADGRRMTDADHLEVSFQNGKATAKVNGKSVDPNGISIWIEGSARVNGVHLQHYPVHLITRGHVGLKSDDGKIEFRNIRFRELP